MIPSNPLAALPLALMAVMLAGCPDTSVDVEPPAPIPVGKLKLVQTIVGSPQTDAAVTYDPDVSSTRDFVLSPDDQELYITSWQGNLLTFDRSATDGTLARVSTQPLFNGF